MKQLTITSMIIVALGYGCAGGQQKSKTKLKTKNETKNGVIYFDGSELEEIK